MSIAEMQALLGSVTSESPPSAVAAEVPVDSAIGRPLDVESESEERVVGSIGIGIRHSGAAPASELVPPPEAAAADHLGPIPTITKSTRGKRNDNFEGLTEKQIQRRLKNREAALASKRKVQDKIADLRQSNESLQEGIDVLDRQIPLLKELLASGSSESAPLPSLSGLPGLPGVLSDLPSLEG
jgi:hypothetical protein